MVDIDEIFRKHGAMIEKQIETFNTNFSKEYLTFRQEMVEEFSKYEKWCHSLGKVIKLKLNARDELKIEEELKIAHLDVEPWQALGLAVMSFLAVFFIGLLISVAVVLIGAGGWTSFPVLFFVLTTMLAVFLFYFVKAYPARLANKWRLKASSQMVPAILYIVVYMRHTPNLEKAIAFASEHLEFPLALDFKKVFYDVQVGKFSSIKESLDNYLETWRNYNVEFIEGFHLIESSLFEPDNNRRIGILEKALQVVLDGVYDKMLKFTHDVRSPLTNVYMLGVVLPTLGLALLPLASAMIGEYIRWYHVFILFNLIVPFAVFYLTDKIMMKRPGGYGETELLEKNPFYGKYKSKKPYFIAGLICLPLLIIGLLPLFSLWFGFPSDFNVSGFGIFGDGGFFDFKIFEGSNVGPFGVGALLLSLLVVLSIALFFSIAYRYKTKEIIVYRQNTKQLEGEFNSSLFQLGNRLGNGVPPELAFGKVAESSKGLMTGDFFARVNYNIQRSGMSAEKAIFDKSRGAILYYPSQLIATSMKILIESSKKGLKIAALSLMSISEYMKNIQKINMRLRDMLAEVISDMKSNMTFLAPLLSGVVVGLAAMIVAILNKLELDKLSSEAVNLGNINTIRGLFLVEKMIPPYFLQIMVGIYIIQVIFILTRTLVAVDSGEDKLERASQTGKNLMKGIFLYVIVSLVAIVGLSLLTSLVLGGLGQ